MSDPGLLTMGVGTANAQKGTGLENGKGLQKKPKGLEKLKKIEEFPGGKNRPGSGGING